MKLIIMKQLFLDNMARTTVLTLVAPERGQILRGCMLVNETKIT